MSIGEKLVTSPWRIFDEANLIKLRTSPLYINQKI